MASYQSGLNDYERILRQMRGETSTLATQTAAGTDLQKIIDYRSEIKGWIDANDVFTGLMGDGTTEFATHAGSQFAVTAATLLTESQAVKTQLENVRTVIATNIPKDVSDNILGVKFNDVSGEVEYDSFTDVELAPLTTALNSLVTAIDAVG